MAGGKESSSSGTKRVKGENFYRDAKAAKRTKMLSGHSLASKTERDRRGNVVRAAEFQSSEAKPGRVQPDRRWFGNTRVIGQDALEHFRNALGNKVNDPYSVLLRRNKLPVSLLQDSARGKAPDLTAVEPFSATFGPGAQRKRPRLERGASSFAELAETSRRAGEEQDEKVAEAEAKAQGEGLVPVDREIPLGSSSSEKISHPDELYAIPVQRGRSEAVYTKGQSRRIWAELYKVIDSSDVVIHVLDARDPLGTRCRNVEKHIRDEKPHKHLVFLLNKVDLVPTWVTVSTSPPSPLHRWNHTLVKCCCRRTFGPWRKRCYECGRATAAGVRLLCGIPPRRIPLPPLRAGVEETSRSWRRGAGNCRCWARPDRAAVLRAGANTPLFARACAFAY